VYVCHGEEDAGNSCEEAEEHGFDVFPIDEYDGQSCAAKDGKSSRDVYETVEAKKEPAEGGEEVFCPFFLTMEEKHEAAESPASDSGMHGDVTHADNTDGIVK
jgi:hypothetical protein